MPKRTNPWKGTRCLLGVCLVVGSIGTFCFGLYIMSRGLGWLGIIIGLLLFLGSADLISPLFGKSLLKAGPLARSMYPNMPEDE